MSDDPRKTSTQGDPDLDAEREEIGALQDRLDAESDEDGLGAEAGTAEENGISQG
ncbi:MULTISPECIES: hypothetical protein [Nocardioides]|nr:hypothetical protein [Nocardioides lianchengensis]NYG13683.1 hypothetical protein [Nocardioides lianchengensis]